jgi:hypothetical protein
MMDGYANLDRSSTSCVHFCHDDDVDEHLLVMRKKLADLQVQCAYVDYLALREPKRSIRDCIGESLGLEHAPYRGPYGVGPWVPFWDDLISLCWTDATHGIVVVVDHADALFAEARDEGFGLIEVFTSQLHHWLERKKPCHLCFQLEENALVRQVFQSQ